jgi:gamma-glutamyltranspeptidase/glutathione hydrolase
MDDFSSGRNIPNLYGLLGSTPNAIAPGKRMVSSMSPTIIERNGKLVLVVGTPGGTTIITSVYQVILNVLEHDFTMQEAVMAKRFHHQLNPNLIYHEEGAFDMKAKMSLDAAGHVLQQRKPIGRVDAIRVYTDEGYLEGGADPRGDDTAEGY